MARPKRPPPRNKPTLGENRWRGYRGSVVDIIYACRDAEELLEFDAVIVKAIMAGKLRPEKRTMRKWRGLIRGRLAGLAGLPAGLV